MGTVRVLVSIVTFRPDLDLLKWTLCSLREQTVQADVMIVLNATSRAETTAIEKLCRTCLGRDVRWTLVARPDNLGFTGGHNLVARRFVQSDYDLLLILNPDVKLDVVAVDELAAIADSTGSALVGPLLYRAERKRRSHDHNGHAEGADECWPRCTDDLDSAGIMWTRNGRHLDLREVPSSGSIGSRYNVQGVSGAALMASRETVEMILAIDGELFDDSFFAYREDAELGVRASWYGIPSLIAPRARGWHVRSLRGTSRRVSAKLNMLGVQNRFLIVAKWGRCRPGSSSRGMLRDLAVVAGAVVMERSSLTGLRRAIAIRRYQRYRGRRSLLSDHAPGQELDGFS